MAPVEKRRFFLLFARNQTQSNSQSWNSKSAHYPTLTRSNQINKPPTVQPVQVLQLIKDDVLVRTRRRVARLACANLLAVCLPGDYSVWWQKTRIGNRARARGADLQNALVNFRRACVQDSHVFPIAGRSAGSAGHIVSFIDPLPPCHSISKGPLVHMSITPLPFQPPCNFLTRDSDPYA